MEISAATTLAAAVVVTSLLHQALGRECSQNEDHVLTCRSSSDIHYTLSFNWNCQWATKGRTWHSEDVNLLGLQEHPEWIEIEFEEEILIGAIEFESYDRKSAPTQFSVFGKKRTRWGGETGWKELFEQFTSDIPKSASTRREIFVKRAKYTQIKIEVFETVEVTEVAVGTKYKSYVTLKDLVFCPCNNEMRRKNEKVGNYKECQIIDHSKWDY